MFTDALSQSEHVCEQGNVHISKVIIHKGQQHIKCQLSLGPSKHLPHVVKYAKLDTRLNLFRAMYKRTILPTPNETCTREVRRNVDLRLQFQWRAPMSHSACQL